MKTTKTFLAILLIAGISNITLAQGGLLGKAKDAAKDKKVDTKKVDPKAAKTGKGGKGGKDDMAVKGSGVPTNSSSQKSNTTPPATNTNK
jgi:hypothetical protein